MTKVFAGNTQVTENRRKILCHSTGGYVDSLRIPCLGRQACAFKKIFTRNTQIARRIHGRSMLTLEAVLCLLCVFSAFPACAGKRALLKKIFTRNTQIARRIHGRSMLTLEAVLCLLCAFSAFPACAGNGALLRKIFTRNIQIARRIHGRSMLTLDSCSFTHKYFSCFKDFCHRNFLSRRFSFSA